MTAYDASTSDSYAFGAPLLLIARAAMTDLAPLA
jgi:hypothetical protein